MLNSIQFVFFCFSFSSEYCFFIHANVSSLHSLYRKLARNCRRCCHRSMRFHSRSRNIQHCLKVFKQEEKKQIFFSIYRIIYWKMVNGKEISVKKRTHIIILQKSGKNYREIADILNISVGSVHTAIKRYHETGQNTDRKRSGRPRKTNEKIDNNIYAIKKTNRFKSASQIRAEINKDLGSPISRQTVSRRLVDKGMFGHIAVRKPLLWPANKQKKTKNSLKSMLTGRWICRNRFYGQTNRNLNFSAAIGVFFSLTKWCNKSKKMCFSCSKTFELYCTTYVQRPTLCVFRV